MQLVGPDALVLAGAVLGIAAVVGILARLALGPASRQRFSALGAEDEPAQGKVLVQVLALRKPLFHAQAFLDSFVGLRGDEGLVVSSAGGHVPRGVTDDPSVHLLLQQAT